MRDIGKACWIKRAILLKKTGGSILDGNSEIGAHVRSNLENWSF